MKRQCSLAAFAAVLCVAFSGCGDGEPRELEHVGQLRLGAVLGEADLQGFARADRVRVLQFPADLGAHPDYRSEWWYLTVMLDEVAAGGKPTGREFGVQFTIFRQALWPPEASVRNPWQTGQVYLGHLALSDVSSQRHVAFERVARGHPELAGVTADPFRLWLDGWRLEAVDGDEWRLEARAAETQLALTLRPAKPLVLQGDGGLSRKGPEHASYYYSLPRMTVAGTLTVAGMARTVAGTGWFDREWSTSVLDEAQTGWDWFALHFDDLSELMVFQLRRRDGARGGYDQGLRVDPDGTSVTLSAADFALEALRYWKDGNGTRWPVEWRVRVEGESWRIVAAIDDQRMDTSLVYWEGLVHIYDQHGRRAGRGYMELTGYADE